MCSGCSGDYAGDFEDSGEPAADWCEADGPAGNRHRPGEKRNRRTSENAQPFEASATSGGESPLAGIPGRKDERAEDICEILVSGTRIIEIRVIAANRCESKELVCIGAAERSAANEHSAAESAKYYQTRRGAPENSSGARVEVAFLRAMATVAMAQIRKQMRWAQQACAISRGRNSE